MTSTRKVSHRPARSPSFGQDVTNSLKNATGALISMQDPDGWWKGELETNVTMDAEDLLLREFLGIRTEEQTLASAKWIRSRQRDDGTWATSLAGPRSSRRPSRPTWRSVWPVTLPATNTSSAPVTSSSPRAASKPVAFSPRSGWLYSTCGRGTELPVLPPELMYLGRRMPLNIYDFGCWARQTIVALTIVNAASPFTSTRLQRR